ncbi:hypothetical protein GCM10025854_22800 [Tetragenococcus muriaticus]|nr:hypothetical protein GCM10025854_22800 [Tetragenococcus muriaticus]
MRSSDSGPKRKYYSLTDKGIEEKNTFLKQWKLLKNNVDQLIERTDEDESK